MSVHPLDDVGVECGSSYGEIECLISIYQRDLSMRRQHAVVTDLGRSLRTPDKSSSCAYVIAVKMSEGVSASRRNRRFRRQILGDVCDTHVQNARRQS